MDRKASKTNQVPLARSNTCGRADIEEIPTKIAFDLVGSRLNKKFSYNTTYDSRKNPHRLGSLLQPPRRNLLIRAKN
jgi:hypothetical protein